MTVGLALVCIPSATLSRPSNTLPCNNTSHKTTSGLKLPKSRNSNKMSTAEPHTVSGSYGWDDVGTSYCGELKLMGGNESGRDTAAKDFIENFQGRLDWSVKDGWPLYFADKTLPIIHASTAQSTFRQPLRSWSSRVRLDNESNRISTTGWKVRT